MLISPEQIRAARALLRMEQSELAQSAGVSLTTIRRAEAYGDAARVTPDTIGRIRQALEAAGAKFLDHGVRRLQPQRRDAEALFRQLRSIAESSADQLSTLPQLSEADLYDEHGLPK